MEWFTEVDRWGLRKVRDGSRHAFDRLRVGLRETWGVDSRPTVDLSTEPVLAVDFGTSTSSAALVIGEQVRMLLESAGNGSWSWPSVVFLDGEELLIGTPAERVKRADPLCYRSEFKSDLGDSLPVQLGEKRFRPEELLTEVLGAFRAEAERMLGGRRLERLVLTMPAAYSDADPRRNLMIASGEQAGFVEVELLSEPVAAAFSPLTDHSFRTGDVVLVYDFGGGTFDAAVVRYTADGAFHVLGHASLEDCGGRDIDGVLASQLLSGPLAARTFAGSADGDMEETAGARQARLELADVVRRLKHQLTIRPAARDAFGPAAVEVSLERPAFNQLVYPLIQRTVDSCRKLLEQIGMTASEITTLLLVGGTSRIPLVAQVLADAFGRPLVSVDAPEIAVTQGAAQWAMRAGTRASSPLAPARGEYPLRWDVPGGSAQLVRWLAQPGQGYAAGSVLLVVRQVDGALWRLIDDQAGTFLGSRVVPGDLIVSGDWIATTRRPTDRPPNRDPSA